MEAEQALIERVQARDPAAFEALYERHHRLVYAIGARMLGEAAAAEDLTQSVFLKVWSAPELFRGGSFAAWIARVARNRALDLLRARAARPESELPADLPLGSAFDDDVIGRLDGARARAALATLPAEQRTLIELGFFGGITHHELAQRTGTPLGTVKTRIRTGLLALRAALTAETRR